MGLSYSLTCTRQKRPQNGPEILRLRFRMTDSLNQNVLTQRASFLSGKRYHWLGSSNLRKKRHISSLASISLVLGPSRCGSIFWTPPGHTCPAPVSFHNTTSVPLPHGPHA